MPRRERSPLTERDTELLVSLYRYGYLTTSQIRRLHFPSLQTTNRRLQYLFRMGYLATMQPRGMREYVDTLTEKGAQVVAESLGVTVTDLLWTAATQLIVDPVLRRVLDVAEFRIALTKECEVSQSPHLVGFVPAHVKSDTDATRRRQIAAEVVADTYNPRHHPDHSPDATFALSTGGVPRLFFLEIDRHVALASDAERGVRHLVDYYDGYWATGAFHRYEEALGLESPVSEFRVLLLVNSKQRIKALQSLLEERPLVRRSECFIWLAERERILDGRPILSTPWMPLRAVRGETCTLEVTPPTSAKREEPPRPRGEARDG